MYKIAGEFPEMCNNCPQIKFDEDSFNFDKDGEITINCTHLYLCKRMHERLKNDDASDVHYFLFHRYCSKCPSISIEPADNYVSLWSSTISTTIKCVHYEKCKHILKHLEEVK